MWKALNFFFEAFIIGYAIYLSSFKTEVTLKDLTWLIVITLIQVIINAGKLERIEDKLKK